MRSARDDLQAWQNAEDNSREKDAQTICRQKTSDDEGETSLATLESGSDWCGVHSEIQRLLGG